MNIESAKRTYRQSARAAAAEATADRILDAFFRQFLDHWFDEIRLEDVAREAGVSVQTVIRRFGSKEGLIDPMQERLGREVRGRRAVAPGDVDGAVSSLIEDYEMVGDLVLRMLAQEDRYPAVRRMTDRGRSDHRDWISRAFEPWLEAMAPDARAKAGDALVVAADLYVWKLVRRDMKRPVSDYRMLLERMIAAAIGIPAGQLFKAE